MAESSLVTRDPATGLRYTPTHWTHTGKIPTPDGCRWCGHERRSHGRMWKPSVGWHKWATPTDAQRLKRMKARRTARIAEREYERAIYVPPIPATLTQITAEDGTSAVIQRIALSLEGDTWRSIDAEENQP